LGNENNDKEAVEAIKEEKAEIKEADQNNWKPGDKDLDKLENGKCPYGYVDDDDFPGRCKPGDPESKDFLFGDNVD
jgi:hypothetical protein